MARRWIKGALGVKPRRRGAGPHHRKSVRVEAKRKGALHRRLGVPVGQKIPMKRLLRERKAAKRALAQGKRGALRRLRQVNFAINARGFSHR